jgi:flagellar biosynthesis/type III secretory pathway chaperone
MGKKAMTATVEKLLNLLEASEGLYQDLLPAIQKEKQAALSAQVAQLTKATEEKEALLAQLRHLERKRQVLIHQVAANRKLPVEKIKLSILVEENDADHSSRARRLMTSLNELVPKIRKANEENRAIMQHCLRIVHGALGLFQHWVMPTDVYGASGQMTQHPNGGNLISGAI